MFRPVAPDEVLTLWPAIEPGLEEIRCKCNARWASYQVRNRLLDGQANLFAHPQGFVILERNHEPLTAEPYLNVWLMYFRPKEAYRIRGELVAWLDEMCVKARCVWWQFGSPREEWAAVIEPYCEQTMTIWRRK